LKATW